MLNRIKIGQNGIETENKIETAIARIQAHEPEEGYYLAFSGGKDSITIYELAKMANVKFDAHYNLTTVDPPELVKFIRDKYPEVEIDKPEMTMWQLIPKKKMPPTRLVRYCCEYLKERGGSGRVVMTGIRWAESNSRSKRRMAESCHKDTKKTYLHPIIDWTERDVWDFIEQRELDYCKLYDEGFDRLGCVMCPYKGAHGMRRDAERWPTYKENYIRAFERMLEVREEAGLETDWETGEEVMEWWIEGGTHKEKVAAGQMCFDN